MGDQITFTIAEIGYAVLFIVFLAALAYAIAVLKNLNTMIRSGNSLIKQNEAHLNRIIPVIADISENALFITNELKGGVKEAGDALELISASTKDTVLRFNETADRIGSYAVIIGELVKVLIDAFSGDHKN